MDGLSVCVYAYIRISGVFFILYFRPSAFSERELLLLVIQSWLDQVIQIT